MYLSKTILLSVYLSVCWIYKRDNHNENTRKVQVMYYRYTNINIQYYAEVKFLQNLQVAII